MEVKMTGEFENWLLRLKDKHAKVRITSRVGRIACDGNLGDAKALGRGLSELRIDCGPGYRLYFSSKEDRVMLLLIGGDKGSQKRDIMRARRILACESRKGW